MKAVFLRWHTIVISLAILPCLLALPQAAQASGDCYFVKRYSAGARLVTSVAMSPGNNPVVRIGGAVFGTGTTVGELINCGWKRWWDPIVEVRANDIQNIVTPVSDSQILGIADSLLSSISLGSVTLADVEGLNFVFPGMGDASVDLLLTGTRALAHTAQGAAAFAQSGYDSPDVKLASSFLDSDLKEYRRALRRFAPYMDKLDAYPEWSSINIITADDYKVFLTDVQNQGGVALPQGEVSCGEQILSLANVHMDGNTLENALVAYVSDGDVGNEASKFPTNGFTTRGLMESGIAEFDFHPAFTPGGIDCPEPPVPLFGIISLSGLAILALRRRYAGLNPIMAKTTAD